MAVSKETLLIIADAFAHWYEASDFAGSDNFLTERARRGKLAPETQLADLQELWPELTEADIKTAYQLYVDGGTADYHQSGSKGEVASVVALLRRGSENQN